MQREQRHNKVYTGDVKRYTVAVVLKLGNGNVDVTGDVVITLPCYITMLLQDQLNECTLSQRPDTLIIAAGRETTTGDIVFVTGSGTIMVLDVAEHDVPDGRALPMEWGHGIVIECNNLEMTAEWCIANSDVIDAAALARSA